MSSGNKRSFGSLIFLILLFALVAGISWVFFSKDKSGVVQEAKQDLAGQVSSALGHNENNASDSHAGHDHDGHDHTAHEVNTDNIKMIGAKGKIHTLNPPEIYGHRAVGNPDAPVKIQEFFSLSCNHCATFHTESFPKIKENFIDTGKVYFVYEEFPLNGPALYGSMIARCLPAERYNGFIDILLRDQDKWAFGGDFKSALMQHAKLAGMSEDKFNACFDNKDLQKAVATNIKEASEVWKVNSTPSFVFNNGERILYGGQTYDQIEKLINQLLDTQAGGEEVSKEVPVEKTAIEEVKTEIPSAIATTPVIEAAPSTIITTSPVETSTDIDTDILDLEIDMGDMPEMPKLPKMDNATTEATSIIQETVTETEKKTSNTMESMIEKIETPMEKAGDEIQNTIEESIDVMDNAVGETMDKTIEETIQ